VTPTSNATALHRVALVGQPNSGKTTLFNALTGLAQRTGNYPGVTVERKVAVLREGVELIDLPGTYSLASHSPDELITVEVLLGLLPGEPHPELIVVVADACNFARSAYLATQVIELGLPTVLALNMVDLAKQANVSIDCKALTEKLSIPVVETVARDSSTLNELRAAIDQGLQSSGQTPPLLDWPTELSEATSRLAAAYKIPPGMARRALIDANPALDAALAERHGPELPAALQGERAQLFKDGIDASRSELELRHGWIARELAEAVTSGERSLETTERLDSLLLHPIVGSLIFFALMAAIFMSVFEWATPLMDGIDGAFGALSELSGAAFQSAGIAGGPLESLIRDGLIAGVGGVLIFIPQIAILFLFLAILEDCGYMARAAFLMDRMLRFCGLSGRSFVPLMSSFACAIPGIMAARTIPSARDRLATMLIAPFMSCSARIPVYALLIAAFVPPQRFLGMPLQGLVFTGMYFVGILFAIPIAWLLTRRSADHASFVMELPSYKWPASRTVLMRVGLGLKAFVIRAGSVILAVTILVWALSYYPRPESLAASFDQQRTTAAASLKDEALAKRIAQLDLEQEGAYLRQSILGRLGQAIEPAVRPLGWDWRIGVAVLASFPAREVVISVFGVVYDLGSELDTAEESGATALTAKLNAAKWPDGRKVYNLPVAMSILVFFALCLQCGATLATLRQETGSWRWPILSFVGMTSLAYLAALITYQAGMALGAG